MLLLGVFWTPALAHRDDYLNETFVFQTLESREFEPELWLDYGWPSDPGTSFRTYAAAFEYGITDHWMVDGFIGWIDPAQGKTRFRRLRAETRHRFGEEGDRRVDVAASFEVEFEREVETGGQSVLEPEESYVLTPRLVLSRDFGPEFNATLNLDLGREIRAHRSDRWSPGYALGLRYPRNALFRYGMELRQDFGEERSSLLVPQVWVNLPRETTFKIGAALDLEGSPRQDFIRVVLEKEF